MMKVEAVWMSADRHFRGMALLDGHAPDFQRWVQVTAGQCQRFPGWAVWVKDPGVIPWNASVEDLGNSFKGTLSESQWTWMRVWVICYLGFLVWEQCWALVHCPWTPSYFAWTWTKHTVFWEAYVEDFGENGAFFKALPKSQAGILLQNGVRLWRFVLFEVKNASFKRDMLINLLKPCPWCWL